MIPTPLLAALAAALVLGGVLLIVDGLIKRPPTPGKPPKQRSRRRRFSRAQLLSAGAAFLVGVVVAVTTGWILAPILLPVLALMLPTLLSRSAANRSITRLEAIEDWTRHLAGRLSVGTMLVQAMTTSMSTVKPTIEPEVQKLVARLRAQWPVEKALDAFGDDLGDTVGDQLVASLKLAARSNSSAGLKDVLADIADSIQVSVAHRRAVDTEQSKLRATARWVTLLTLALLAVGVFTPFMSPYGTPIGQLILAVLMGAYLACLVWIRRTSEPPAPPRILVESHQS